MVHYYYYVSAGAECDSQTKIYKVAVGTTKQCQRDYSFLMAFALQHGHYFEIVSRVSDDFIIKLRHSLVEFSVQVEWLSCRDLVQELRDTISHPLDSAVLRSNHLQQKSLNLNYRISSNLSREKRYHERRNG